MTALFVTGGLIWLAVLIYALPGAVSAFSKNPRRGDAMRAGVAAVAILIVAGSLRYLFAPHSQSYLIALFVYLCGVGCFVLWLMHTYGRGGRVH